jgi:hypothetical protein
MFGSKLGHHILTFDLFLLSCRAAVECLDTWQSSLGSHAKVLRSWMRERDNVLTNYFHLVTQPAALARTFLGADRAESGFFEHRADAHPASHRG